MLSIKLAAVILHQAQPSRLAGFSTDLLILRLNSETAAHDDKDGSFYEKLKAGERDQGFYAAPWREVCEIFQALSAGRAPK